ncbi:MAG TPA: protein-disulfide reductase DsbD domain-containing protein, partial [Vicinamibacteria bacterium]|nr:protein-disulfide reductase DsbD domain-containing protein [Vicinamibacteria bacterium]
DHFLLRLAASNREVTPGNRVTLVLDFEMGEGRHAYAPGAEGYRPLRLRLDGHPLVTVHEPAYPPSRPFEFKPLAETVPVYDGRFRLLQDVTLADGGAFAELLKAPDPTLALTGALDYQVCSETVCYPPASLPLSWSFRVLSLDRERAPEAIRHRPAAP